MSTNIFYIFGNVDITKISVKKEKKTGIFLKKKVNKSYLEYSENEIKDYIVEKFHKYIEQVIDENVKSAKHVLDYLESSSIDVFIRKDKIDESEYIQVHFFTCAGMTEVSSKVACHWFQKWYVANYNEINSNLKKYGFTVDEEFIVENNYFFIETGDYGYAIFMEELECSDGYLWSNYFEVDNSILSMYKRDKKFLEYGKELDKQYDMIIKEQKCQCVLCK